MSTIVPRTAVHLEMSRGRILHILGDSKFGGDSVLVLALGRAAQQHGFEVDVLATHSVFQDMIQREGLGLVDLDVIRRPIRPVWDIRGLFRLTDYLRKSQYLLVHTHTSKAGIVGRLAARRARVPVIIHTVHGFSFHEESGWLPTLVYGGIERLAARWCDRIVTVSEFHRSWALKIGAPSKIIDIPNGLPPERTHPVRTRNEVREQLGVSDDVVVLSTGRLAEQKGLEYLIRAVPLLGDALPSVVVLLAGEGPLRLHLEALASRLGIEKQVRFLGFRSDIADLLAACDLVVLPSLWEGLSVSLLEAMAAGKPTITTSIGSNVEVTNNGDVALLVPPKDPAALADALQTLASDARLRADLGHRAKQRQNEHYTLTRMSDAYLAEYERLLGQKAVIESF
jgi:glycosyltransferase involved in cell wall biosynthesis